MVSCPDSLLGFAERLAEASGPLLRRYFRSGVAVIDKRPSRHCAA